MNGNVLKFVKKEKSRDALGVSDIKGGHLYLRTNNLIRQTFGNKGQLLDYVASHIEAGICEEYNGKLFFYKSAKALGQYFCISTRQAQRWVDYFKDNGILTVEKFNATYNVNYMAINKDVLRKVVSRRVEVSEKLEDDNLDEEERKALLKEEEALVIERIEESNGEIEDLEVQQDEDISLLSAIGEIVEPLKQASIPKEMVNLWNDVFNTTVEMSPDLARNLVAAFKCKFSSDYGVVDKYFKTLSSWSVHKTLDQVLAYKFIDKWMSYADAKTGVGIEAKKVEEKAVVVEDIDIKRERDSKSEPKNCIDARARIAAKIGESYYRSWFHLSKFSITGNVLTILAPNLFTRSKQCELYEDLLNEMFGKGNVIIL